MIKLFGYDTDEIAAGNIRLGNDVYVTDPGYNTDVWCCNLVHGFAPGKYNAYALKDPDTSHVAELLVYLDEYDTDARKRSMFWTDAGIDVGVDSGQAGFFSKNYYEQSKEKEKGYKGDASFGMPGEVYDSCCSITLSREPYGPLKNGLGVVSSTGWGDGVYDLYVAKNDIDQIVAARLVFMDIDSKVDENEEEEDE